MRACLLAVLLPFMALALDSSKVKEMQMIQDQIEDPNTIWGSDELTDTYGQRAAPTEDPKQYSEQEQLVKTYLETRALERERASPLSNGKAWSAMGMLSDMAEVIVHGFNKEGYHQKARTYRKDEADTTATATYATMGTKSEHINNLSDYQKYFWDRKYHKEDIHIEGVNEDGSVTAELNVDMPWGPAIMTSVFNIDSDNKISKIENWVGKPKQ